MLLFVSRAENLRARRSRRSREYRLSLSTTIRCRDLMIFWRRRSQSLRRLLRLPTTIRCRDLMIFWGRRFQSLQRLRRLRRLPITIRCRDLMIFWRRLFVRLDICPGPEKMSLEPDESTQDYTRTSSYHRVESLANYQAAQIGRASDCLVGLWMQTN